MALASFFWMQTMGDDTCGHEGFLPTEQYDTQADNQASEYFLGELGDPGNWSFKYENTPCDISRTPFSRLISPQFKALADSFGINANFHSATVLVDGVTLEESYYLVLPPVVDAVDRNSPKLVISEDEYTPGWLDETSPEDTYFHRSKLSNHHWILQEKSFYFTWIVSRAFKEAIEAQGLSNFKFTAALITEDN